MDIQTNMEFGKFPQVLAESHATRTGVVSVCLEADGTIKRCVSKYITTDNLVANQAIEIDGIVSGLLLHTIFRRVAGAICSNLFFIFNAKQFNYALAEMNKAVSQINQGEIEVYTLCELPFTIGQVTAALGELIKLGDAINFETEVGYFKLAKKEEG